MNSWVAFYPPEGASHDPQAHSSERAERLTLAREVVAEAGLACRPAPPAPDAALLRVHTPAHLARVAAFCEAGGGWIDEDTYASPGSDAAARSSAGAALAAVDAAVAGAAGALALTRPPGHHALPDATMGFCFYANAAVAARHAQAVHGLRRVLIVDWDLHHGNGTEAVFEADASVLTMSAHQWPNWPGTGRATDVGAGEGLGYAVNAPLPIGSGDRAFEAAFETLFEPVARQFAPELILVAAGFDANFRDPLGRLGLTEAGYHALARRVRALASEVGAKVVVLLEGGYDLPALGACLEAALAGLRDLPAPAPKLGPSPYPEPLDDVEAVLETARRALAPYWSFAPSRVPERV